MIYFFNFDETTSQNFESFYLNQTNTKNITNMKKIK